jgi:class 3 adenylate cyclase
MTLTLAIATIVFAAVAAALYRQWQRGRNLQRLLQAAASDLEHLQRACARLAPAGVVQSLVADGIQPDAGPTAERKLATALFVDLVGFTGMSERLGPEILLRIINGYYQRVSEAIDEHRGHIGSFVGDGIVAYFGAIQPNPWQCDDAVHAALAMRTSISAYNAELAREGLPPIAIGIGIDRGPGLAGLLGSHARREYAFIGRPVNLAARLQALTRVHRVDILVSEALRTELDPGFILRAMPAAAAKGFAEPMVTYAVEGRSAHTETAAGPRTPVRSSRDVSA